MNTSGKWATVLLQNQELIVKEFPCHIFIDLCHWVKESGFNANVTTGFHGKWIWSSDPCYPRQESNYPINWDSTTLVKLDELDLQEGISRIQIFTPAQYREQLKQSIINRNYPAVVTTSDDDMIDLGPLNSSKGIAILELCERYGIDLRDVIVVGDFENDIAMFAITKHSYCIDLADSEVQRKASKWVASLQEAIDLELKNRE